MMQKLLLIALFFVAGSLSSDAQSLKELLYGGKLRMDSNSVLRKTDDIKARIDPNAKQRADSLAALAAAPPADSAAKTTPAIAATEGNITATETAVAASNAATTAETNTTTPAAPAKTNTRLWKEYTDSLVNILRTEAFANKRIKSGTYHITVSYEINTDGSVGFLNVVSTPENALLQSQTKQIMESTPLFLNPVLDSNNQPRKAKRSHNFTVTKD